MEPLLNSLDLENTNVISPLMAKHWEGAGKLRDVTAKDWLEDLYLGMEIAKGLGDKVIIVGYSMALH